MLLERGKLSNLRWNERDILKSIENEKAKPQNDLTRYYINKLEDMLQDIREQIKEEELKVQ